MAEIKNPIAKAFYQKAAEFIARLPVAERSNLPVLEGNIASKELDAWYWYFANHLGWVPAALKSLMEGRTKAFTVPAQWPDWFDLEYAPPPNVPRAPKPHRAEPHTRLAASELMRRIRALKSQPTEKELRGEDYYSMKKKYGRPIGRFEGPRQQPPRQDDDIEPWQMGDVDWADPEPSEAA